MVAFKPNDIANLVQKELNTHGLQAKRVRVVVEDVRPGGSDRSWWYVPVSYQEDARNTYKYYEAFAEIEAHLERARKLNVLLVPRIVRLSES